MTMLNVTDHISQETDKKHYCIGVF